MWSWVVGVVKKLFGKGSVQIGFKNVTLNAAEGSKGIFVAGNDNRLQIFQGTQDIGPEKLLFALEKNPLREAVTFAIKAIDEERNRNCSCPPQHITQQEFSRLQFQFREIAAECRVAGRHLDWPTEKVDRAIDDLESAMVGVFRPGQNDPHKNNRTDWLIGAINRCSAAAQLVERLAGEYEVERRLIGAGQTE
jgi:hypothetical protein